jgi:hypothetical protein
MLSPAYSQYWEFLLLLAGMPGQGSDGSYLVSPVAQCHTVTDEDYDMQDTA